MKTQDKIDIDLGCDKEDISLWSSEDVHKWLIENGYKSLATMLSGRPTTHSITGQTLLALTRTQLQQAPFHMTDLHEIDHLLSCIETLKNQQLAKFMKKKPRNGFHPQHNEIENGRIPNGNSLVNMDLNDVDLYEYSKVTSPLLAGNERPSAVHDENKQYPPEILKTFVALAYMMFGFVVSVFMLQVVHERVPPMEEEPPLPDIFFDVVPKRIEGSFEICEWAGMILTMMCVAIFFFHKHRFIVVRRIFVIMGILYLYRSLTTFVTTLPVPGLHFKCAPKVHYKFTVMVSHALAVLSGGGLTVTGAHHYCGDYLFSGHTIILVITYLTVAENTPKRWWWLHWVCWLLAATGIVCILLAHDHYTVDIVVAYLLTTRLYWTYHSMCSATLVISVILAVVWLLSKDQNIANYSFALAFVFEYQLAIPVHSKSVRLSLE